VSDQERRALFAAWFLGILAAFAAIICLLGGTGV